MSEIRRINLQKLSDRYEKQREFADVVDLTPAYINHLLTGYRNMGEKTARKIEAKLKLPHLALDNDVTVAINQYQAQPFEAKKIAEPNYAFNSFDLWDSTTPLRDDEVELPFFREIELSAGTGRHEVIENHGCKLRFSKSTLKRKGIDAKHAACVTVSGNSMEPVLPDKCVVGIDTNATAIKNGDMYAIDHQGELRVKMLYRLVGDGIRLRSYNEDYPDEMYTHDEAKNIKVLGRVFWCSWLV